MPGLLGKKLGMTNLYSTNGKVIPVTIVEAGPCPVVEIRTKEKDGYEAVQLGFGSKKEKHLNKPEMGNFQKKNLSPVAVLKEFSDFDLSTLKIGDTLKADLFVEGEKVKIIGTSKGKGFQGVVKRHNFSGVGGQTHGQHNRQRSPGSIGASSYPSRVYKGTRMAGRMGNNQVTVKNSKVIKIDVEKNLVFVLGAVPGAVNSIVEIRK
ncbi:MAG: 50S ribosomal protein L3 [Ignavibacteriales bacterium CG_4_9_14_3_um_filter_34_10]|nr:MAG: 50S ribosomal protein L3 [Ignavibacteriales bacterium CG_4_9_14_3_um_filter_34_10]